MTPGRGRLHGMDKDGKPLDMTLFGAVFIKYSSAGGQISDRGDAMLNGYSGSFRGVYFNPVLPDGKFRQYAVLPLDLFSCQDTDPSIDAPVPTQASEIVPAAPQDIPTQASPKAIADTDSAAKRGWTIDRVEEVLAPLLGTLARLDVSLRVLDVDDSSGVCLRCTSHLSVTIASILVCKLI